MRRQTIRAYWSKWLMLSVAMLMIACTVLSTPERLQPTALPSASPAPTSTASSAPMPTIVPTVGVTLAPPTPTSDPTIGRVDQLLSQMTTEEKVGQLFLVFFYGPNLSPELKQMIDQYHIGGIVLFALSDNVRSMPQVAELINAAQGEAVSNGAKVPLFVAIDHEGGPVVRLTQGATVFPSNMAVGATDSVTYAQQMAQVGAIELKALGINMNLAPVVDVNNNPDNPVIGIRSFGSAPEHVAELGRVMISTYKANGVIATAKHFPGHGDTAVDSHVGLPLIPYDLNRLQAVELAPFQAAIDSGVDAIMTAHVLVPALEPTPGLPATLSDHVLQQILRGRLNFQGLILSDSLSMGALDQTFGVTQAAELAFKAGVDVLAFGADPGHRPEEQQAAYQRILSRVRAGEIPMARLDEAVRRILLTKARYHLLDWSPVNLDSVAQQVGTADHLAVARQIAQASITLVKDDQAALPLTTDQSVLAIWPTDSGNLGNALRNYHANVKILQVDLDPTLDEIAQAEREAQSASIVIVGTVNARQHPNQVQLVRALDRPLVVAALASPYDLMAFPEVATYLATYGDVTVSLDALAQVVFGVSRPNGHLPVELPGVAPLGQGLTNFVARN